MIWCVEDDGGIRDIEIYALNSAGFETRAFEDGLSFWEALKEETPDLILLDGGKGPVSVVKQVMEEMGLDLPVFGMVKDDFHKTRALCDTEREISIARIQQIFVFIYKLQEEVHRYTVGRMTEAKRKTLKTSSLEAIRGIGPQKAKTVLMALGSLDAVKKADVDTLAAIKGISKNDAASIFNHFNGREKEI